MSRFSVEWCGTACAVDPAAAASSSGASSSSACDSAGPGIYARQNKIAPRSLTVGSAWNAFLGFSDDALGQLREYFTVVPESHDSFDVVRALLKDSCRS